MQFFGILTRQLPASAPPAERRLVRWVSTVYRVADDAAENPTDAAVWTLALYVEALKATAREAVKEGMNECHVRSLVGLAFVAALQVLDIAAERLGFEEVLREAARLQCEENTP